MNAFLRLDFMERDIQLDLLRIFGMRSVVEPQKVQFEIIRSAHLIQKIADIEKIVTG